ncbi:hypothetical protein [Wenjunlia vitaminophila]|uniref:hypothetical protein n=1 Tax=Wenjunlia vitaminophila TaxID=76728 RepID=UPI0003A0ACFA|nr:hypothetical protein [Wenjunlia vitaminophila]
MNGTEAVSRLVLFGDACGSGRLGLEDKKLLRRAMYGAFADGFDAAGVASGEIHQEDRGDGILVALDPSVPPAPMVGRWVDAVYESLRAHNRGSAVRTRLRVALHAGPVAWDGRGLVGRAVDLTCRLCDSPTAKQVMAAAEGSDLLFVASDWIYTNVVAEGGRYIEPEHYRPARITHKETDELAWFHVPRLPEPPVPTPPRTGSAGNQVPGAGSPPGGGQPGGSLPPPRSQPDPSAPPAAQQTFGRTEIHVQGDNQTFQHNVIHGGFVGIRKGGPDDGARGRRG